jgi:hypothetical protein
MRRHCVVRSSVATLVASAAAQLHRGRASTSNAQSVCELAREAGGGEWAHHLAFQAGGRARCLPNFPPPLTHSCI